MPATLDQSPKLLLIFAAAVTSASAAIAYTGSSQSSVHYVPVHQAGSLFHPGGIGLVKVVQANNKYSNNGNGYRSGGYVYYDQLPNYYGKLGSRSSKGYGEKGYVYYDQLPNYGKGYGNGYGNDYKNGYDYGYGYGYGKGHGHDDDYGYGNDHGYGKGNSNGYERSYGYGDDSNGYNGYEKSHGDSYSTRPRSGRGSGHRNHKDY